MRKKLLAPLQNSGLRILLFITSLVLFMLGGLYMASWLSTPGREENALLPLFLLAVGGLLLFKARSSGD